MTASSPTIREFVEAVANMPLPILFLDTCSILDILRAAERSEIELSHIENAIAFHDGSKTIPRKLWIASCEQVTKEYKKHIDEAIESLSRFVRVTEASVLRLEKISRYVNPSEAGPPVEHLKGPKRDGFTHQIAALAERLVSAAIELWSDDESRRLAVDRCLAGRKPAKKGGTELGDCVILETYLSICKQLRDRGVDVPTVFVTSNLKDYYDRVTGTIHADLEPQCTSVELQFAYHFSHARSLFQDSGFFTQTR